MKAAAVFSPFPGLRPFEPDEDHLFFGREREIDELLRRLRQTRFLSVVGAALVLVSVSICESTTGISMGIISSGFGNGIGVTTSLIAIIATAGSKDQADSLRPPILSL